MRCRNGADAPGEHRSYFPEISAGTVVWPRHCVRVTGGRDCTWVFVLARHERTAFLEMQELPKEAQRDELDH